TVEELRQVRLPDVVLESVRQVTPDAQKKPNAAAHVEVKGVIGGHIRFELLLADAWNGRFVMGGGGGFVGNVEDAARDAVTTGCGGQAMMEAQQYPNDFEGIVAGAPAFHWTGLAAKMLTIAKALYPDPGHLDSTVLTKEALQKLQAGILEQCDSQDGLKDGIIQDPASAHFDLSKVAGLTEEQRKAIDIVFREARNDKGLIYPGFTPVAECDPDQWIAWLIGPAPMLANDHAPDLT